MSTLSLSLLSLCHENLVGHIFVMPNDFPVFSVKSTSTRRSISLSGEDILRKNEEKREGLRAREGFPPPSLPRTNTRPEETHGSLEDWCQQISDRKAPGNDGPCEEMIHRKRSSSPPRKPPITTSHSSSSLSHRYRVLHHRSSSGVGSSSGRPSCLQPSLTEVSLTRLKWEAACAGEVERKLALLEDLDDKIDRDIIGHELLSDLTGLLDSQAADCLDANPGTRFYEILSEYYGDEAHFEQADRLLRFFKREWGNTLIASVYALLLHRWVLLSPRAGEPGERVKNIHILLLATRELMRMDTDSYQHNFRSIHRFLYYNVVYKERDEATKQQQREEEKKHHQTIDQTRSITTTKRKRTREEIVRCSSTKGDKEEKAVQKSRGRVKKKKEGGGQEDRPSRNQGEQSQQQSSSTTSSPSSLSSSSLLPPQSALEVQCLVAFFLPHYMEPNFLRSAIRNFPGPDDSVLTVHRSRVKDRAWGWIDRKLWHTSGPELMLGQISRALSTIRAQETLNNYLSCLEGLKGAPELGNIGTLASLELQSALYNLTLEGGPRAPPRELRKRVHKTLDKLFPLGRLPRRVASFLFLVSHPWDLVHRACELAVGGLKRMVVLTKEVQRMCL